LQRYLFPFVGIDGYPLDEYPAHLGLGIVSARGKEQLAITVHEHAGENAVQPFDKPRQYRSFDHIPALEYVRDTLKIFAGEFEYRQFFMPDLDVPFDLTLIRYEFLSRIAMEGALPASFSKECYEDLLALKTQLIATHTKRQERDGVIRGSAVRLGLLALTDQGMPDPRYVEVIP